MCDAGGCNRPLRVSWGGFVRMSTGADSSVTSSVPALPLTLAAIAACMRTQIGCRG